MQKNIIDAHNHPNWSGVNIDELVADMDRRGIARTWLLGWDIPRSEYEAAPQYYGIMDPRCGDNELCAPLWMVVEAMQRYPGRFIGGWAPDPRGRHARERLSAAVCLHGIAVYGELKCRMRYDNPDAIAMFDHCAKLGLPVLFHLQCSSADLSRLRGEDLQWPEWHGGDFSVVNNMCRLCPDTMFIGHGPGFWREMSADADDDEKAYPSGPVKPGGRLVEAMRRHDNLYCDLSAGSGRNALARDIDHAKKFLSEFQDRIIFGRDSFDGLTLELLDELNLDSEAREKILHLNAEKLTPGR